MYRCGPAAGSTSAHVSRTEGDGVVRLEITATSPERGPARLVVCVYDRVRAVALCNVYIQA